MGEKKPMGNLRIVIDDASDIPEDLVERHKITVMSLVVRFGDEVCDDGSMTIDEFWAKKARTGLHPQTSQPASGRYAAVFRELVETGNDVLCIAITSKHSGTYNSAWLAAQQFPGRVTVFDSLSISWGEGWLAVKAAEAAESGADLPEVLRRLERYRSSIRFPILLDTIEDVRRGGRADRVIPLVEKLLRVFSIKPLLTLVDGELKMLGTARSYEKGLSRMLDIMDEGAPYENLAVFHTRQPEAASAFADWLAERVHFPRERIRITEVGPALATHAGPRAMAAIGVPQGV